MGQGAGRARYRGARRWWPGAEAGGCGPRRPPQQAAHRRRSHHSTTVKAWGRGAIVPIGGFGGSAAGELCRRSKHWVDQARRPFAQRMDEGAGGRPAYDLVPPHCIASPHAHGGGNPPQTGLLRTRLAAAGAEVASAPWPLALAPSPNALLQWYCKWQVLLSRPSALPAAKVPQITPPLETSNPGVTDPAEGRGGSHC